MTDEVGFKSADALVWLDVSDEVSRTYIYPSGFRYTVFAPLKLNVKPKGAAGDSHRIQKDGGGVYVRPGWVAIEWDVKSGAPSVAF